MKYSNKTEPLYQKITGFRWLALVGAITLVILYLAVIWWVQPLISSLLPYLFTAASYALIIIEKKLHTKSWVKTFVLSALGFTYSLWAIYGSGSETVYYGFLLLLIGIPVYIYMKWFQNKEHK